MKYLSTRGKNKEHSLEEAVMKGLSSDGGLFVPIEIPKITNLSDWKKLNFSELAFEILTLYIGDEISAIELRKIISKSYSSFDVDSSIVTPTVDINDKLTVLELFHGPTFAFKDIALQLLGNLFDYFLTKRGGDSKLNILGATSGDTGSAAIYALKGISNINVCILFPNGKVSPVQEAQMTSVLDDNVHNISIEVKTLFNDKEFNQCHKLGAINSINIARILAQITYYFYSYFRLDQEVLFYSVPTGNFGDVLAGYYALKMGLPIKLIVATNENDILTRFFHNNNYKLPNDNKVKETLSPAMDILVSSNFERLIFHLAQQHFKDYKKATQLVNQLYEEFKLNGEFSLPDEIFKLIKNDIISFTVNDEQICETIYKYHNEFKYLLDPHTAVGIKAAEVYQQSKNNKIICLSTAHPAKFPSAITMALKLDKLDFDSLIGPTYLPNPFRLWLDPKAKKKCFKINSRSADDIKTYIEKHF